MVAWAELNQNRKGSYIVCLFVVKNWQRKGLGTALVNSLIQEATPPLSLTSSRKQISFYSRLGFVQSRSSRFLPYRSNIFSSSDAIFGQYMVYKDFNLNLRLNKP